MVAESRQIVDEARATPEGCRRDAVDPGRRLTEEAGAKLEFTQRPVLVIPYWER
jgi:hypothetical protein